MGKRYWTRTARQYRDFARRMFRAEVNFHRATGLPMELDIVRHLLILAHAAQRLAK